MLAYFFTWRYALRRFVGVGRTLAKAGHELVVAIPRDRRQTLPTWLRQWATVESYDEVSDAAFGEALALLRQTRDYAWYLSPAQQVASFNRRRALENLMQTASAGAIHADPDWPDPVISGRGRPGGCARRRCSGRSTRGSRRTPASAASSSSSGPTSCWSARSSGSRRTRPRS